MARADEEHLTGPSFLATEKTRRLAPRRACCSSSSSRPPCDPPAFVRTPVERRERDQLAEPSRVSSAIPPDPDRHDLVCPALPGTLRGNEIGESATCRPAGQAGVPGHEPPTIHGVTTSW